MKRSQPARKPSWRLFLRGSQSQLRESIRVKPRANPFAYLGGPVAGKGTLPPLGSVANANESINGSLVLFRLKTASFENRPLVLKILGPTVPQDEATVDLDV